jgi:hypothetical protein
VGWPVHASVEVKSHDPAPAPSASSSASDLRVALGRLLGEHAYLVMESMRAAAEGRPDLEALTDGLAANTDALRGAVASVFGEAAGSAFVPIWQQHIDALLVWASAEATGDAPAANAALATLHEYRIAFGKFLTDANPKISGDAEAHALQLHLDQLTSFVGADYARSFATERAAYSHMFDFGDDLARAIIAQFPDRFPDGSVAFSPRTSLRLDLGRLLGEHLVLAAEAMRAGLAERPDMTAAAASLEANSRDLARTIGRALGLDAGEAFGEVWDRHVTTYLRYIEAVRDGDAAARGEALASLHMYHSAFADFLNAAIPALSRADLEALISHHVTALINQVDAAAAGDHERTVAVTREAYAQMFEVGDALSTAIADQFPEGFVHLKETPATDTLPDVVAGDSNFVLRLVIVLGAAIVIGLVTFWSRRPDRGSRARVPPAGFAEPFTRCETPWTLLAPDDENTDADNLALAQDGTPRRPWQ